jgi:hypothetical protein
MAWTVESNEYQDRNTVYRIWNGQADANTYAAAIFDCSTYVKDDGTTPTKVEVSYMRVSVSEGIHVKVELDATSNVLLMACPSNSTKEFPPPNFPREALVDGELSTTDDSGVTGDIVLTSTVGAVGEGASVEMVVVLV